MIFVTHSVFESVYLSQRIVVMTPRPGRVFTEIVIDAPYPRDERFRTSAGIRGILSAVAEALAQAMASRSRLMTRRVLRVCLPIVVLGLVLFSGISWCGYSLSPFVRLPGPGLVLATLISPMPGCSGTRSW